MANRENASTDSIPNQSENVKENVSTTEDSENVKRSLFDNEKDEKAMLQSAGNKNAAAQSDGVKYSYSDIGMSIDRYTEKQYNDFGWVSVNNVLTGKEMKKIYSKFADKELLNNIYPKSANGEYLIAVGDTYNLDDKIVYISGTNKHPKISKVIQIIDLENIETITVINEVVEYERKGYINSYEIVEAYAGKQIFRRYTLQDCISYSEAKSGKSKDSKFDITGGSRNFREGSLERSSVNVEVASKDDASAAEYAP